MLKRKPQRPLRVLHVGNIANNAYNNAKVQRQRGIEADVLCFDYYHVMGCPEWEDADFTGDIGDPFYPDWWACNLHGFQRPKWFAQGPLLLAIDYLIARGNKEKRLVNELWQSLEDERRLLCSKTRSQKRSLMRRFRTGACFFLEWIGKLQTFVGGLRKKCSDQMAGSWLNPTRARDELMSFVRHRDIRHIATIRSIWLTRKLVALVMKLSGRPVAILKKYKFGCIKCRHDLAEVSENLLNDTSDVLQFATRPVFKVLLFFQYVLILFAMMAKWAVVKALHTMVLAFFALLARLLGAPTYLKNKFSYYRNTLELEVDEQLPTRMETLVTEFVRFFPQRKDKLSKEDLVPWACQLQRWKKLFGQYDVVQMYSTYPIIPLLCGFDRFAAYEHGTIREIPFEDNSQGRICAIGYKLAPAVFVTNSDNLVAAERLNLSNDRLYCLPHAFDNEKLFRFCESNKQNFFPSNKRVVFFSPTRQHWKDEDPSMAKGNDRVFHAVRALKEEGYKFTLELVEWGRDVSDSKRLIRDLDIEDMIVWVPAMKKRQLWQKYMSVHAVIDQLLLPALGGVGFETMALGRRLLTAMDMQLGEKFFGVAPPLFDVRDKEGVKAAMRKVLEDPDDQAHMGADAREWIRCYHSADRVCQIQVEAYQKILS